MLDYRKPENRGKYFTQLYTMNLEHKVMPGLVYLYFPELASRLNLTEEQKLWFATLNGFTQNPITTLRMFDQLPNLPTEAELVKFDKWFNENWETLNFDSDRLKNKRNTVVGIRSYVELVKEYGSQVKLWDKTATYSALWARARRIYSFGRLSCFSYLEYVKIMGYGTDCDDLMFYDLEGSRSHRNGWFFMTGRDNLIWDRRHTGGIDRDSNPDYDPELLFETMPTETRLYLRNYNLLTPHPDATNFTLESQCCQFKNGFFGRRYPGVYADMAWDRIKWYDERRMSDYTEMFKDIRTQNLPDWLREECEAKVVKRSVKATQFMETGVPFRAEYFIKE